MTKLEAPFMYYGIKNRIAPTVWELLGDVKRYSEPFAGSLAVLLNRPEWHTGYTETVNDKDGWLVNAWRSIKLSPKETAELCLNPVSAIDYRAQQAWLQEKREDFVPWLEGHPEHHDPKLAAWWLNVQSTSVNMPFKQGKWHRVDGKLRATQKSPLGIDRTTIHQSSTGKGINRGSLLNGNKKQNLEQWFNALSERLLRVRITNSDYMSQLTKATLITDVNPSRVGLYLDPPYDGYTDRYAINRGKTPTISADLDEWLTTEAVPWIEQGLRVIISGYGTEHDGLLDHGWGKLIMFKTANTQANNRDDKVDSLWFSPAVKQDRNTLF